MFNVKQKKQVTEIIVNWSQHMGRHTLPWRHTNDLYHILVSEVMLQQTNVPKVVGKYNAFLQKFPDIESLATAKQSDVLIAWQGLGYNRRAVNLHKLAKIVQSQYNSKLPETADELLALPGIGPYTSNAVLIFGRNQYLSAVDVNVQRVISRVHGKRHWNKIDAPNDIIKEFIPKKRSRQWHGALMDFASLICTKHKPKCLICPLQSICQSYPDPKEAKVIKTKEKGTIENGKHIPRRIFRGRIVEQLRTKSHTIDQLGFKVKSDYNASRDKIWLQEILDKLAKEGMIERIKQRWQLK